MHDPIAVTGVQLLTCLGEFSPRNPAGFASGKFERSPRPFSPGFSGQIEISLIERLGGIGWRNHNRASLMACLTGQELWQTVSNRGLDPEQLGVSLGYNSHVYMQEMHAALSQRNLSLVNPALFLHLSNNAVASNVAIFLHYNGFVLTHSTGFTAGLEAIAAGVEAIENGRGQAVMAGGVESWFPELQQALQYAYQKNGTQSGLLNYGSPGAVAAGEGCAWLLLERDSKARQREVYPLAYLSGIGWGFNPQSTQDGNPQAAMQAIEQALAQAGVLPGEIGAVFLSANGNPAQDLAEARALEKIFPQAPPMTALKSLWGEAWHAGGAMALAASVLCARHRMIPATLCLHATESPGNLLPGVSTKNQIWRNGNALVLAMDQDVKAIAVIVKPMPKVDSMEANRG